MFEASRREVKSAAPANMARVGLIWRERDSAPARAAAELG
jgi:hypothetical protein